MKNIPVPTRPGAKVWKQRADRKAYRRRPLRRFPVGRRSETRAWLTLGDLPIPRAAREEDGVRPVAEAVQASREGDGRMWSRLAADRGLSKRLLDSRIADNGACRGGGGSSSRGWRPSQAPGAANGSTRRQTGRGCFARDARRPACRSRGGVSGADTGGGKVGHWRRRSVTGVGWLTRCCRRPQKSVRRLFLEGFEEKKRGR